MLQGDSWAATIYVVSKALVAIGLWGCAAIGFGVARLNWAERLWAFAAAAFLVAAMPWTDEVGLGAAVAFVAWHLWRRRASARAGAAGRA